MDQPYTIDKIKELFNEYKMYLNGEEYDLFCNALSYVPPEIIDRIKKEVYFVVLGSGEKPKRACYQSLESKDLNGKKGIIILTPLIFDIEVRKKENNILYPAQPILHEVAHHILSHIDFMMNSEQMDTFQKQADKLANKWLLDRCIG